MIAFGYYGDIDFDTEDFLLSFKADRPKAQDATIELLRPLVEQWLADIDNAELKETLLNAATSVWGASYQSMTESPILPSMRDEWRESIGESLDLTSTPDDPPSDAQIDRVTIWLSVNAINAGTLSGFTVSGGNSMRWVTMHDAAVRETHVVADNQVAPVGGTFDVGGYDLRYPGEPVGPPSIWINCRCILAPAGRRGRVAAAVVEDVEDPEVDVEDEIEETDIEGEDLVDDVIEEIPVHGVATIEGKPTGDHRMFALDSLTNRELPLPMRYEFVGTHGGDTSMVAPVGRIDELWRQDVGGYNEYRFRGVIITTKEYANQALEGIADGSLTGVSVEVDDVVLDPENEESKVALIEAALAKGEVPDPRAAQLDVFSEARVAGFTIVPIPAYQEGYIAIGEAFEDELSEEDREALAACGCMEGEEFRDFPADERKKAADKGHALPDGSFPIENVDDLKNAIQAIGRAKDPDAAKAHIKKRARELGQEALIPEDWESRVEVEARLAAGILNSSMIANHPANFAPGTKDGPGWITHPRATARIRRYWTHGKGAAKIKWGAPGDFNRCRRQLAKYVQRPDWLAGLCANMHKEALGIWPSQHAPGGRHALMASGEAPAPLFLMASGSRGWAPAAFFENPNLKGPTPLQVDLETGQVYGHLATWGVCHIGIPGVCTTAPHSNSNYAQFRTGTFHADGKKIPVGQITLATGHAPIKATARAAAAHYDNTGSVVADIAAGEDSYGIWVAGALRPNVDEDTARILAAARLSGDWREINGSLELVGALAVNVPGFPIPHTALAASADGQTALVAAGIVQPETVVAAAFSAEEVAAITRNAVAEYRHQEKREARLEALRPVREQARKERIEAARALVVED